MISVNDSSAGQSTTSRTLAEKSGRADAQAQKEFDRLYTSAPPERQNASPSETLAEKSGVSDAQAHNEDPLDASPPSERQNASQGEWDRASPSKPEQKEDQDNSLSSLMSSLFSERLGTAPAPTPTTSQATAPAVASAQTDEMVKNLVQQILVSDSNQVGEQEVRLRVRDSLLPDTEIRLTRGADGLLSVTLTTGRSDSFQTLVTAQTALKNALNAQEKQEVRLVVTDSSGSQAEDGSSNRRSRGYIEDWADNASGGKQQ